MPARKPKKGKVSALMLQLRAMRSDSPDDGEAKVTSRGARLRRSGGGGGGGGGRGGGDNDEDGGGDDDGVGEDIGEDDPAERRGPHSRAHFHVTTIPAQALRRGAGPGPGRHRAVSERGAARGHLIITLMTLITRSSSRSGFRLMRISRVIRVTALVGRTALGAWRL